MTEAEAEGELERLAAGYPQRRPRRDLDAVEQLLAAAGIERVRAHVVVVGTNGKTSTATYVARLLQQAGARTGLVTSPHIARWSERVRIGERPLGAVAVHDEVARLARAAAALPARGDLRFFDLLTLAAEALLARAGVDVAVFEAGIGGRLDTVRVLRPPVVVLTGVDLDHTELLGPTREHILVEKLGAAPPGALVLAAGLDRALTARAAVEAEHLGVRLELVRARLPAGTELPPFLEANLQLARRAAAAAAAEFGLPAPAADARIRLDVRGRFEEHELDGVLTLVDAAHNPQAWRAVVHAAARRAGARPLVALVALAADRDPGALADALAGAPLRRVFATAFRSRPSRAAGELADALAAAGLPAVAEPEAATAWQRALDVAASEEALLLAFGSSYLLGELPPLADV